MEDELALLRRNGQERLAEVFQSCKPQLERLIAHRLDSRVAVRVAVDDILQESFVEASTRLSEYTDNPDVPLPVWIRFLVSQRVQMAHRRHREANKRSVAREVRMSVGSDSSDTALSIARQWLASHSTPSLILSRCEVEDHVRECVNALDELDRRILELRHDQEFSNRAVAEHLSISEAAASKRYTRALKKLAIAMGDSAIST